MKKALCGLFVLVLGFGVVGCANKMAAKDVGPALTVTEEAVAMSKKAKVTIAGKGFESGQKINLLFVGADGVKVDIGYALDPAPVANDAGEWSTTWDCGRFVSKKLIKVGTYPITATDDEYNALAETTATFVKGEEKK